MTPQRDALEVDGGGLGVAPVERPTSDHSQSIPLQEELCLRVLSQVGGLSSRGLWTELLRTTTALLRAELPQLEAEAERS